MACFEKTKEELDANLKGRFRSCTPDWLDRQRYINENFEKRTAWEPKDWQGGSADLSLRNYVKNNEIDVESLWSVRPEIKNKFL